MIHIIAAREYLKANNEAKAKLELDSALVISPKHSMANSMMGDILFERQNYLLALMSYDKAILNNAGDAELFIKRAELHIKLKNHRTYVVEDFNRAITLESTNITFYLKKANFLASSVNPKTLKSDYGLAAMTISEAIAFNRENSHLYYLRSKYFFGDGKNLASLADINKAIELTPYKDLYLAERGYINFMIANYRAAYADYSKAIKLNQQNSSYFEFRGHANYNMERYPAAFEDYSRSIDLIISQIAENKEKLTVGSSLNKQLRGLLLYRGMSLVYDDRPYDGCDDFNRAYQMGEVKARNYIRQYCN